jgi:hypothetical protein
LNCSILPFVISFNFATPKKKRSCFSHELGALNDRRPAIFLSPTYTASTSLSLLNFSARLAKVDLSALMDLTPPFSKLYLSSCSFLRASVFVRQYRLNSFCFQVSLSTGANLAIHRFLFSSKKYIRLLISDETKAKIVDDLTRYALTV